MSSRDRELSFAFDSGLRVVWIEDVFLSRSRAQRVSYECVEENVGSRRAIFAAAEVTSEECGTSGPKQFYGQSTCDQRDNERNKSNRNRKTTISWLSDLPSAGKYVLFRLETRCGALGRYVGSTSRCIPKKGASYQRLDMQRRARKAPT